MKQSWEIYNKCHLVDECVLGELLEGNVKSLWQIGPGRVSTIKKWIVNEKIKANSMDKNSYNKN